MGGLLRTARLAAAHNVVMNREQARPAGNGVGEHHADQSPRRLVHARSIAPGWYATKH